MQSDAEASLEVHHPTLSSTIRLLSGQCELICAGSRYKAGCSRFCCFSWKDGSAAVFTKVTIMELRVTMQQGRKRTAMGCCMSGGNKMLADKPGFQFLRSPHCWAAALGWAMHCVSSVQEQRDVQGTM